MPRVFPSRHQMSFESFDRLVGLLKVLVLPILAGLIAGAIWVHDTSAAIDNLEQKIPTIERIERKVDSVSWKVDLLLEERGLQHGRHTSTPRIP